MTSRIFASAAATMATLSFASLAHAGCGGTYCSSGHSTHTSSHSGGVYTTMSPIEADHKYGTGSISSTYSENVDVEFFSGSTSSISGLGYNETLQSTTCPVGVLGAAPGSKVLGCYNVVKPVPQTTYYQVVRPVIYVRYPVPVAVPYTSPCLTRVKYSRYGDAGYGYGHSHAAHHVGHHHPYGYGHSHAAHHGGGCY